MKRQNTIDQFSSETYDLLIIGGGITGAGVALDAASRGLKVALVEKGDFASGTSSKSTKLIHGGLRYLKQFEISLVREVGQERALIHKLAPHLVIPEKMLLPLIKNGTFGKWATTIGLFTYDLLAGVSRKDKFRMLDKKETMDLEPLLPEEKVLGAGLYAEYRTDDARLTIEVMKTAGRFGALPLNYVLAEKLNYVEGQVAGATCKDVLTGQQFEIKAKFVVNATGPWSDELRKQDGSLTDITCVVQNPLSVEEINKAFELSATNQYKGILEYTEEPIVSSDVIGNSHSCVFDSQLTSVIGNMVKIVGWYDNEMGYSNRLVELVKKIG